MQIKRARLLHTPVGKVNFPSMFDSPSFKAKGDLLIDVSGKDLPYSDGHLSFFLVLMLYPLVPPS